MEELRDNFHGISEITHKEARSHPLYEESQVKFLADSEGNSLSIENNGRPVGIRLPRVLEGSPRLTKSSGTLPLETMVPARESQSWPGFVNYVERCFRGSPKATESRGHYYLSHACLAGLRPQAESYFL
jgi:hypothetical protein